MTKLAYTAGVIGIVILLAAGFQYGQIKGFEMIIFIITVIIVAPLFYKYIISRTKP